MNPMLYSLVFNRPYFQPDGEGKQGSSPEEIGIFTLYLLIASSSVLFLGGIIAYFWMNYSLSTGYKSNWSLQKIVQIDWFLCLASLTILGTSFTLNKAKLFIQRDFKQKAARYLLLTWILGFLFLMGQGTSWLIIKEYFKNNNKNIYIFIYYLLTFLHAFHLFVGFSFLSMITIQARRGAYSAKAYSPIRFLSIYWHYLTIVWFSVLATLLL